MRSRATRPAGPPAASVRGGGGIGRSSSRYAERVSDDLRRRSTPDLTRRRVAVALGLAATAALAVVEAYQTGLLRRVPEPRLPGLDADRGDAAGEAYHLFGTPDAGLGIASYGATLVLHGAGPADRAESQPWLPLLAAAKSVADAAAGVYLFAEQISSHRKLCSWCTVAALANVATVPVV
ncbi:MAG TPA: vitamin K epoxide reductase family protein, partial [Cryptosporangiaceae bacterium]|nr:vitamin K epoxide reductase family protein [Cryptosporangiaceae bacterium]